MKRFILDVFGNKVFYSVCCTYFSLLSFLLVCSYSQAAVGKRAPLRQDLHVLLELLVLRPHAGAIVLGALALLAVKAVEERVRPLLVLHIHVDEAAEPLPLLLLCTVQSFVLLGSLYKRHKALNIFGNLFMINIFRDKHF